MSSLKKEIKVFFSWQSNLDKKHNQFFILKALKKSIKKIEENNDKIKVIIDQATADSPGSPAIVETIMKKISLSQVVISDVTIIKNTSKKRSFPNPNVIFELGYAVSELGWGRIIALTNNKYGYKPEDLPFDINSQRVSQYDSDDDIVKLENLLFIAINTIINHNPKTPQELRGVSIDQIKHEKDSTSLEELMCYIHTHSIDDYLSNLPKILKYDGSLCFESFQSLYKASNFNFYDLIAKDLLTDIYTDWNIIESSCACYCSEYMSGNDFIFRNKDEIGEDYADEVWGEILNSASRMKENFQKLLDRIHYEYPEIDISETNKSAWKDILKYRPKY